MLKVEHLGQPVRGRNFFTGFPGKSGAVIGPSCSGEGFSAYGLYRDHIVKRDPWTIFQVDLQTQIEQRHRRLSRPQRTSLPTLPAIC